MYLLFLQSKLRKRSVLFSLFYTKKIRLCYEICLMNQLGKMSMNTLYFVWIIFHTNGGGDIKEMGMIIFSIF